MRVHRATVLASAILLARANAQSDDGSQTLLDNGTIAHGILMGLAFAVLFPVGTTTLRLFNFKGKIWVHAGIQILAYTIALAAFGLGVWIAIETDQLVTSNGHAIIGIIVIGALLLQPLGGLIAHKLFVKNNRANIPGRLHRWAGRIFLVLGVINGGLGLQLSGTTGAWEIAYAVLAAVFFALWIGVVVWKDLILRRA